MSIQTAEQFEENEQYTQAYDEYKRLYEKNPKDLSLLERLGHLSMLLENFDQAAEHYTKILESDATNVLAYEQLMDIYVTKDRYKYYIYRGNLHSVEHKLEHAINDYKKALNCAQEDNQILSTRFVLGTLYEQNGDNLKAIDEYLKVCDYENAPQEAYLRLSKLYVKESAVASAIEVLERARKNGLNSVDVNENLSDLYLKNGNPEKAIETTNDELTKVKCLLDMNNIKEAEQKLTQMDEQYNHIAQFHALKAQSYYMNKNYDEALKSVEKYDEYEKNSPLTYQMRALIFEDKNDEYNAHINWGKYNLVRGNKDIAINEYLNAFQIKDNDVDLLNTLAVLLEESGDKNHAMEFYERISKIDGKDRKALSKLAEFRKSIGDYRTQTEYLEKLYNLDSRNSTVIRELAEAYERIKNKPSAVEFYKKYLEVGKGNPDYSKIQHKLDKLENTEMQEEEGLIDKIFKWFNKD